MNITLKRIALICSLLAGAGTALAANQMPDAVYDAAKSEIKYVFKLERDACIGTHGNTQDVCEETAKGREKVALVHLEWQRTGSESERRKLADTRAEVRRDVAEEKCDALSGNAKDACKHKAKADHEQLKAQIQRDQAYVEAREEAEETRLRADYKAASERCDALSGTAKDSCMATARARFGM